MSDLEANIPGGPPTEGAGQIVQLLSHKLRMFSEIQYLRFFSTKPNGSGKGTVPFKLKIILNYLVVHTYLLYGTGTVPAQLSIFKNFNFKFKYRRFHTFTAAER